MENQFAVMNENFNIASRWKGSNFSLDYKKVVQLEKEFGSFYLLDVNKLRENYMKIDRAFRIRYKDFIIGYSYKTNYLPYVCKELSKLGAYAEVVSRLEYDLAIKLNNDPKKIIFNGPLKSREDIFLALNNGSMINLDSVYEVEFVEEYALEHKDKQIKVGLRLNFDISDNGKSALQEGYEVSRFGICVENGNFSKVLSQLRCISNVKVVGLHGHFSTKNRSVDSYRKITEKLCSIVEEDALDSIEYIDIGGGIYGELPKVFNISAPSFNDYAEVICKVMNNQFGNCINRPTLILEPGIAMVANVFMYFAKVIELKTVRDKQFVLVDGSVHNIKPTMHKNNLPMKIIRQNYNNTEEDKLFNIVGYTCMEKDYLAYEVVDRVPEVNDFIVFENVGAYTLVFNPPFIKERPAVLGADCKEIMVLRNKESFNQFFNEDLYTF